MSFPFCPFCSAYGVQCLPLCNLFTIFSFLSVRKYKLLQIAWRHVVYTPWIWFCYIFCKRVISNAITHNTIYCKRIIELPYVIFWSKEPVAIVWCQIWNDILCLVFLLFFSTSAVVFSNSSKVEEEDSLWKSLLFFFFGSFHKLFRSMFQTNNIER